MNKVDIIDVVKIFSPEYRPMGNGELNIDCPDHACSDKRAKTLNIDPNNNGGSFHCPKCGRKGGYIALYGLLKYGPSFDVFQVKSDKELSKRLYKEILEDLQVGVQQNIKKGSVEYLKDIGSPEDRVEPLDAHLLNEAYTRLLRGLRLNQRHKKNLLDRGLTEQQISKLGYKSVPNVGSAKIVDQMDKEGYFFRGVPGFYQENGIWIFRKVQNGFYIPSRNLDGEIQFLQIRVDEPNEKCPKYLNLSSNGYLNGAAAKAVPHFVGEIQDEILITEGILKADIINALSGRSVIGTSGTSCSNNIRPLLDRLSDCGVKTLYLAFDMDYHENEKVHSAYERLIETVKEFGFEYKILHWDPKYKGLDDFILEKIKEGIKYPFRYVSKDDQLK